MTVSCAQLTALATLAALSCACTAKPLHQHTDAAAPSALEDGGDLGATSSDAASSDATASNAADAAVSPPLGDAAPSATASADAGDQADAGAAGYVWQLPPGFPEPAVPADNPMSAEKVELGRHLFYDVRLSHNQTQACSSCHVQALAFTDGLTLSVGSTGEHTPRGSMSLANVGYASTLTWANPLLLQLEQQALVPMFGEVPVELGLRSEAELVERLSSVELYQQLFAAAYPAAEAPISLQHVVQSLASFQRTLISGRSAYDRFLYDQDESALSASAKRGYELFNSEKLECMHCHVGFNLTDHVNWQGKTFFTQPFHNTGLYNIDGQGGYPEPNTGQHSVTGNIRHMGRFKAPSLRNIAVTAPYMHDGSIATLSQVLDHYAAGGRTLSTGENAGVGSESPTKSTLIRAFDLTQDERADVLEFLNSLTDHEFLSDPRHANPWP